jgi:hypothetical protein
MAAKRGTSATKNRDAIFLAALQTEWPFFGWMQEYKFHPERQWRFDFASTVAMIALEIEGGVYVQGRHSRGAGMEEDMRKYNAAAGLGWKVIRATPQMFQREFKSSICKWIDDAAGGLSDV